MQGQLLLLLAVKVGMVTRLRWSSQLHHAPPGAAHKRARYQ
jgi:hypothetical protein